MEKNYVCCSSCSIYILNSQLDIFSGPFYIILPQTICSVPWYLHSYIMVSKIYHTMIPQWEKNDRILMKQWWVCACDLPKATTGEVWKREMIKAKLCTVENRAIIGRPSLSLLPLFPRDAGSLECKWGQCASLMYWQTWRMAESLWHQH